MIVGPFLASSLLTVLGGVMVMSQLGIGDPNQGVEYTLGSVAAVLLTLCAVAVYSQAAIIQSKSLAERRAGIAGTRTAAAIILRC